MARAFVLPMFMVGVLTLIAAAALLIVFVHSLGWRAAFVTAPVCLGLIMLIDSNTNARLEAYKTTLVSAGSGR